MSHVDEEEFVNKIVSDLIEIYGEDEVQQEVVLPATQRRIDIVVNPSNHPAKFAIEVENNFEAVFSGIGQAEIYAAEIDATPLIMIPEGHVEYPEIMYLSNSRVEILQYPYK